MTSDGRSLQVEPVHSLQNWKGQIYSREDIRTLLGGGEAIGADKFLLQFLPINVVGVSPG